MHTIDVDYLVVGAGAMGMAFTDTIVAETDATVAVIDRGQRPGGHWTIAYPFVRLHQPSAFYGVNSRALGGDTIDRVGWNEGLYELATGGEVCAYFDQVMQQQLLPTGRVSYFPMSEYLGNGRFHTISGSDHTVRVRRRIVDATYMRVVVPSMRSPEYVTAAGIDCVPPNDLPLFRDARDRYVVVGAGKTGIDVCLWLLRHGTAAEKLTWVMPRDSWLLDRALLQPGPQFAKQIAKSMTARLDAITNATSIEDLFDRLEEAGNLMRLDPRVRPTMYRCATVSRIELDELRRIDDVVRLGHVERIEPGEIVLTGGKVAADPKALYIDCTADGLKRRPATPVFGRDRITLQSVRGCQQVFSAALIGHVEATSHDDRVKNDLCVPVPHPDSDLDWLRTAITDNRNQLRWLADPELRQWLAAARLDLLGHIGPPIPADSRVRDRALSMAASMIKVANENLETLLSRNASAATQQFAT
jgi:hypothetical protein